MKKRLKQLSSTILAGCLCVVCLCGVAFAGTTHVSYNTTVGRLNGSGYTGYQTKATTGAAAYLKSTSVGGGYKVDVRMQDKDGNVGSWKRDVVSSLNYWIDGSSSHKKDKSVRLHFSNDITTPVNVQVTGTWASN